MGRREACGVGRISVSTTCASTLHLINVGIRVRVYLVADAAFEEGTSPSRSLGSSRNLVEAILWEIALARFGKALIDNCDAVLDLLVICFRFRAEFEGGVVHHSNGRKARDIEGTKLVLGEGKHFQDFRVEISRKRVLEQGMQRRLPIDVSLRE